MKLFFEMNDLNVPWKKLTRGLPKAKNYADDRVPRLDEIQKIVLYPDWRMKAIVYSYHSIANGNTAGSYQLLTAASTILSIYLNALDKRNHFSNMNALYSILYKITKWFFFSKRLALVPQNS
ncbi:MAG: hypothetical protein ACRD8W_28100 [Nitrososphaeraceae archaeon]